MCWALAAGGVVGVEIGVEGVCEAYWAVVGEVSGAVDVGATKRAGVVRALIGFGFPLSVWYQFFVDVSLGTNAIFAYIAAGGPATGPGHCWGPVLT